MQVPVITTPTALQCFFELLCCSGLALQTCACTCARAIDTLFLQAPLPGSHSTIYNSSIGCSQQIALPGRFAQRLQECSVLSRALHLNMGCSSEV